MVESFGAFVAITLTILFASTQGPSGDSPRSIRDAKAFASLVNLTEGRACNPTSCRMSTDARSLFIPLAPASDRRQFFGGATHGLKRGAGRCFGRGHDCPLDDRRVANDDTVAALLRQHFNRHLAVCFGAAEVDQNGNTAFRPRLFNRPHDRFDACTQSAARIPAAPAERHFTADHLLNHESSAPRHVRRVRHDDDSNILAHANPSMTSATASTISADDRAPGSMRPMLRSPRNEARPRIARIGIVPSAATLAAAFRRAAMSAPPSRKTSSTGKSTSSMVFWPTSDFPRALTASIAAANASAARSQVTSSSNDFPSDMNKVP